MVKDTAIKTKLKRNLLRRSLLNGLQKDDNVEGHGDDKQPPSLVNESISSHLNSHAIISALQSTDTNAQLKVMARIMDFVMTLETSQEHARISKTKSTTLQDVEDRFCKLLYSEDFQLPRLLVELALTQIEVVEVKVFKPDYDGQQPDPSQQLDGHVPRQALRTLLLCISQNEVVCKKIAIACNLIPKLAFLLNDTSRSAEFRSEALHGIAHIIYEVPKHGIQTLQSQTNALLFLQKFIQSNQVRDVSLLWLRSIEYFCGAIIDNLKLCQPNTEIIIVTVFEWLLMYPDLALLKDVCALFAHFCSEPTNTEFITVPVLTRILQLLRSVKDLKISCLDSLCHVSSGSDMQCSKLVSIDTFSPTMLALLTNLDDRSEYALALRKNFCFMMSNLAACDSILICRQLIQTGITAKISEIARYDHWTVISDAYMALLNCCRALLPPTESEWTKHQITKTICEGVTNLNPDIAWRCICLLIKALNIEKTNNGSSSISSSSSDSKSESSVKNVQWLVQYISLHLTQHLTKLAEDKMDEDLSANAKELVALIAYHEVTFQKV